MRLLQSGSVWGHSNIVYALKEGGRGTQKSVEKRTKAYKGERAHERTYVRSCNSQMPITC